ncbi:MAG: hypothetical protein KatS3mg110_1510 [Pirellulaceae bacterium]|nr:MAG: hypothetical protein KatS3mg110_1510 [Pirellulaceae bacterium]
MNQPDPPQQKPTGWLLVPRARRHAQRVAVLFFVHQQCQKPGPGACGANLGLLFSDARRWDNSDNCVVKETRRLPLKGRYPYRSASQGAAVSILDKNPYSPPRAPGGAEFSDDGHVVRARFRVDDRLAYRCLRFEAERTVWLRQVLFVITTLLLAGMIAVIVAEWPLWLGVLLVTAFILLNLLSIILPDLWATYWQRIGCPQRIAQAQRGNYLVELHADDLRWQIEGVRGEMPLREVRDAYYLGDLLLVFPSPFVVLPIPRAADFGADDFPAFCRIFAMRLRQEANQPQQIPRQNHAS